MPLELVTLPCLKDNYAFLLYNPKSNEAVAIDVPEPGPLIAALSARQWNLVAIFLTHHHADHIDGVAKLKAATGAAVFGNGADAHRLPPLDRELTPGETLELLGERVEVIDVPGHTVGHIAFHFPDSGVVATGDSLMALGCGRLFEGTPEMMWESLSRLASLPPETLVCSGHEYTESNLRFAETLEPANPDLISRGKDVLAARAANQPTVPSKLSDELATNPFLRASNPALKASIGLPDASDAAVFAEIRARKDNF